MNVSGFPTAYPLIPADDTAPMEPHSSTEGSVFSPSTSKAPESGTKRFDPLSSASIASSTSPWGSLVGSLTDSVTMPVRSVYAPYLHTALGDQENREVPIDMGIRERLNKRILATSRHELAMHVDVEVLTRASRTEECRDASFDEDLCDERAETSHEASKKGSNDGTAVDAPEVRESRISVTAADIADADELMMRREIDNSSRTSTATYGSMSHGRSARASFDSFDGHSIASSIRSTPNRASPASCNSSPRSTPSPTQYTRGGGGASRKPVAVLKVGRRSGAPGFATASTAGGGPADDSSADGIQDVIHRPMGMRSSRPGMLLGVGKRDHRGRIPTQPLAGAGVRRSGGAHLPGGGSGAGDDSPIVGRSRDEIYGEGDTSDPDYSVLTRHAVHGLQQLSVGSSGGGFVPIEQDDDDFYK